jgi:hypothetical protein
MSIFIFMGNFSFHLHVQYSVPFMYKFTSVSKEFFFYYLLRYQKSLVHLKDTFNTEMEYYLMGNTEMELNVEPVNKKGKKPKQNDMVPLEKIDTKETLLQRLLSVMIVHLPVADLLRIISDYCEKLKQFRYCLPLASLRPDYVGSHHVCISNYTGRLVVSLDNPAPPSNDCKCHVRWSRNSLYLEGIISQFDPSVRISNWHDDMQNTLMVSVNHYTISRGLSFGPLGQLYYITPTNELCVDDLKDKRQITLIHSFERDINFAWMGWDTTDIGQDPKLVCISACVNEEYFYIHIIKDTKVVFFSRVPRLKNNPLISGNRNECSRCAVISDHEIVFYANNRSTLFRFDFVANQIEPILFLEEYIIEGKHEISGIVYNSAARELIVWRRHGDECTEPDPFVCSTIIRVPKHILSL